MVHGLVDVLELILPTGYEVDAGRVSGHRKASRQEGPVVRAVVPRDATLIHTLLPEGRIVFDRFQGALFVQDNGLAILSHFVSTEAPD